MRDLDQDPGAVAGVGFAAAGAPVVEVDQGRQAVAHDLVRLPPFQVDEEADAAGVVLVAGVVEALGRGIAGRDLMVVPFLGRLRRSDAARRPRDRLDRVVGLAAAGRGSGRPVRAARRRSRSAESARQARRFRRRFRRRPARPAARGLGSVSSPGTAPPPVRARLPAVDDRQGPGEAVSRKGTAASVPAIHSRPGSARAGSRPR